MEGTRDGQLDPGKGQYGSPGGEDLRESYPKRASGPPASNQPLSHPQESDSGRRGRKEEFTARPKDPSLDRDQELCGDALLNAETVVGTQTTTS